MSPQLKGLVAILALTTGAWVWADLSSPHGQEGLSLAAVSAQGAPLIEEAQEAPQDETADEDAQAEPQEEGSAAPLEDAQDAPPVSARELRIATLPFLVTDDPLPEEDVPAEAVRGARATVNPFAPILRAPEDQDAPAAPIPTPATAPAPTAPPAPATADVPIRLPDDADATPPEIAALPDTPPAPAPALPDAPAVSRLPRALPSAAPPATPALLQQQRYDPSRAAAAPPPQPRPEMTARVATAPPETTRTLPQERLPVAARTLDARVPVPEPRFDSSAHGTAPGLLQSYLNEHDLRYAGSVVGPVAVGIFRSNGGTVVVPLGQTLPESDIVVTDISSQQAELTLAGTKTTLPIDPGR